jgi:hypothetical protein
MSTDATADVRQVKYKEFMSLLPLTLAVAGLPESEPGKYYTEGQMENRATNLRAAYKVARQLIQDVIKSKAAFQGRNQTGGVRGA